MKRNTLAVLVVFAEFEKISDYVYYLAEQMKHYVRELVITVNGVIDNQSKEQLSKYCDQMYIRDNEGFDCAAYKDTLEQYIGWDKIGEYDEVILLNDSCFGPLCSLEEMFQNMDDRKLDFWGITEQLPMKKEKYSEVLLPYHIQTYFIVISKRMLMSADFKKFWSEVDLSNEYDSVVANFELKFANYFKRLGYSCGAYIDATVFGSEEETQAYVFMNSYKLVAEQKCPFLKKKVFTFPHDVVLECNLGETAKKTLDYVSKRTLYDEQLVWQYLVQKCTLSELRVALHLDYCLSTEKTEHNQQSKSAAVILVLTKEETLERYLSLVLRICNIIDVIIVVNKEINESKLKQISDKVHKYVKFNSTEDRYKLGLLVEQYSYICFISDHEDLDFDNEKEDMAWWNLVTENLLCSDIYIKNIINLFEENKRLAILCLPKPYMGREFTSIKEEPLLKSKFWYRREVFQNIFENMNQNGGVIEKQVLDAVKENGYYLGTVRTEKYASVYMSNYYYMLQGIVKNILLYRGVEEFADIAKINNNLVEYAQNKNKIYIYGVGNRGNQCLRFLQVHGISIEGFVVSQGRRKENMVSDIKVYELSELEMTSEMGMIIAVNKKHYRTVCQMIEERRIYSYILYEK